MIAVPGLRAAATGRRRNPVAEALALARSERIAVIGIGDSNQLQGGTGWDHGLQVGLYERFGCWGTGMQGYRSCPAAGVNCSFGQGAGVAPRADSGAPSELEAFAAPSANPYCYPGYNYIPDGSTATNPASDGFSVSANHAMDVSGKVRAHYSYGTFPTGTGSFRPIIRRNTTPFTELLVGGAKSSTAAGYGIVDEYLELAAAARDDGLEFRYHRPGVVNIVGPFFASYQQWENVDKVTGIAYSTLIQAPGQSLVDMLGLLTTFGSGRLQEYFRQATRLIGPSKTVVVTINSGMNDRNEATPSAGGFGGDSQAAYAENLRSLCEMLRSACFAATGKYPAFWFVPSHPISSPDDSKLESYRPVAARVANEVPNAHFTDIATLFRSGDLSANGWYASAGADTAHLVTTGYEAIGRALVDAVMRE